MINEIVHRAAFERDGVVMVEHALTEADVRRMARLFAPAAQAKVGSRQSSLAAAERTWLAKHPILTSFASALAGETLHLVRAVTFDKTAKANWFVPWHQDRTIAVASKVKASGFGPWTWKDGLQHVEAPAALLERMVTLRVHLDECDESNGPLEVLQGTHRDGRLDASAVRERIQQCQAVLCLAARGDILAMRPLLLHRSQRALSPRRRRILHLDFGPAELPDGLRWAWDVDLTRPPAQRSGAARPTTLH